MTKKEKQKILCEKSYNFISEYMVAHEKLLNKMNIDFLNAKYWYFKVMRTLEGEVSTGYENMVIDLADHLTHQNDEIEKHIDGKYWYQRLNNEEVIKKNIEDLEPDMFKNKMLSFLKECV